MGPIVAVATWSSDLTDMRGEVSGLNCRLGGRTGGGLSEELYGDPDEPEADASLLISLLGLELRLRFVVELVFSTSITRSFCSRSSAFLRLCAILPACSDCWIKTLVGPDEGNGGGMNPAETCRGGGGGGAEGLRGGRGGWVFDRDGDPNGELLVSCGLGRLMNGLVGFGGIDGGVNGMTTSGFSGIEGLSGTAGRGGGCRFVGREAGGFLRSWAGWSGGGAGLFVLDFGDLFVG